MRMRSGWWVGCAAVGLMLCGSARLARAANAAELLVPQTSSERHGLTRAWFTQIPVGGRSRITHIVQDDGTLLVQTSAAMLYALDTETGRILWSQQVGEPKRPTQRPAANGRPTAQSDAAAVDRILEKTDTTDHSMSLRRDKVVAVANGTTLYLLNRSDGSIFLDPKNNIPWKVSLHAPPETGPLVTDDIVYVPNVVGQTEVYMITDSKRETVMLSSLGRTSAPPVQVLDRIAWATDRGVLQVTQPKTVVLKYRIETTGPIVAMLAVNPPQFFAGSIDGYLYCVNANTGEMIWKLTAGSPIRESPVVIGGAVFAVAEDGGMFRAGAADGNQAWFNPAARHFLAASPTKIYALDAFGRMLIINAKSGATIDGMTMPEAVLPVQNGLTDRVFLTSEAGLIQCLHETGLTEPQNYLPPKPVEKAAEADAPKPPKAKPADADKPKPMPMEPATPKEPVVPKEKPAPKEKPTPAPRVVPRRGAKAAMP
jgi:outer membrane protein assembly factor BamB